MEVELEKVKGKNKQFKKKLTSYRTDVDILKAEVLQEKMTRRVIQHQFMKLKGKIRVFCRVRPLLEGEEVSAVSSPTPSSLEIALPTGASSKFELDGVMMESIDQETVFGEVELLIDTVFE